MRRIFTLLVLICCQTIYSQFSYDIFRHYVRNYNLIDGGKCTVLDNPAINGVPSKTIIVQNHGYYDIDGNLVNDPYPVKVEYDTNIEKWVIKHEDESIPLKTGTEFSIIGTNPNSKSFIAKADSGSIDSSFPNVFKIDQSGINDDPNVRCWYTRYGDVDDVQNLLPVDMGYDYSSPGRWNLSVPSSELFPVNDAFHVICDPPGGTFFQHVSLDSNVDQYVNAIDDFSYHTILDDPAVNNNPDALLFVSHRREPGINFFFYEISTFYNEPTGRWWLRAERETPDLPGFPTEQIFNVVAFEPTLSETEVDRSDEIKIYPNPAKNLLYVNTTSPARQIEIHDLTGKLLLDFEINPSLKTEISAEELSMGTYFVKVHFEDKVITKKVLVR